MRRRTYRTDLTTGNFDVKKLHEMICAFLELVDDFVLMIDDENYQYRFNEDNELIIGINRQPKRSSPVESLIFSDYADNLKKMKGLVDNYSVAFSCLNEEEKFIFKAVYHERLTDTQIVISHPDFYDKKIKRILDEAIIKFALKSGLYKLFKTFSSL